jgi:hypothetical protein
LAVDHRGQDRAGSALDDRAFGRADLDVVVAFLDGVPEVGAAQQRVVGVAIAVAFSGVTITGVAITIAGVAITIAGVAIAIAGVTITGVTIAIAITGVAIAIAHVGVCGLARVPVACGGLGRGPVGIPTVTLAIVATAGDEQRRTKELRLRTNDDVECERHARHARRVAAAVDGFQLTRV